MGSSIRSRDRTKSRKLPKPLTTRRSTTPIPSTRSTVWKIRKPRLPQFQLTGILPDPQLITEPIGRGRIAPGRRNDPAIPKEFHQGIAQGSSRLLSFRSLHLRKALASQNSVLDLQFQFLPFMGFTFAHALQFKQDCSQHFIILVQLPLQLSDVIFQFLHVAL